MRSIVRPFRCVLCSFDGFCFFDTLAFSCRIDKYIALIHQLLFIHETRSFIVHTRSSYERQMESEPMKHIVAGSRVATNSELRMPDSDKWFTEMIVIYTSHFIHWYVHFHFASRINSPLQRKWKCKKIGSIRVCRLVLVLINEQSTCAQTEHMCQLASDVCCCWRRHRRRAPSSHDMNLNSFSSFKILLIYMFGWRI